MPHTHSHWMLKGAFRELYCVRYNATSSTAVHVDMSSMIKAALLKGAFREMQRADALQTLNARRYFEAASSYAMLLYLDHRCGMIDHVWNVLCGIASSGMSTTRMTKAWEHDPSKQLPDVDGGGHFSASTGPLHGLTRCWALVCAVEGLLSPHDSTSKEPTESQHAGFAKRRTCCVR